MCSWPYLLEKYQVRQFVKFIRVRHAHKQFVKAWHFLALCSIGLDISMQEFGTFNPHVVTWRCDLW